MKLTCVWEWKVCCALAIEHKGKIFNVLLIWGGEIKVSTVLSENFGHWRMIEMSWIVHDTFDSLHHYSILGERCWYSHSILFQISFLLYQKPRSSEVSLIYCFLKTPCTDYEWKCPVPRTPSHLLTCTRLLWNHLGIFRLRKRVASRKRYHELKMLQRRPRRRGSLRGRRRRFAICTCYFSLLRVYDQLEKTGGATCKAQQKGLNPYVALQLCSNLSSAPLSSSPSSSSSTSVNSSVIMVIGLIGVQFSL